MVDAWRPRAMIASYADFVQRNAILQRLYLLVICTFYLMHSPWLPRTILVFLILPIFLVVKAPFAGLRPIFASGVFLSAALFLFLIPLSAVFAGGTSTGSLIDTTRYAVLILAFLLVTAELVRTDDDFLPLLIFFMALAAAVCAIVNIGAFDGYSLQSILSRRLEGVRGLTFVYNSNPLGAIYAIPCVGAVARISSVKMPRWQLVVLLGCALVLLIAVVLTQSRGALVALLAGIGVSTLLAARWRQRIIAAVLIAAIFALLAATSLLLPDLDRGDSLRLELWPVYLHWATLKPWFGYGLDFDTRTTLPDGREVMNAHNIVLCALVRSGVFCALALVGLIVTSLVRGWQSWRRRGMAVPLALLCTGLVATSVDYELLPTELDYSWVMVWLPVAICLGAGLRAGATTR